MFSRLGPRIISWRDTVIARPIPTKCRVENLDSLRALAIVMVTNQQVIAFPGFVFGPPACGCFLLSAAISCTGAFFKHTARYPRPGR